MKQISAVKERAHSSIHWVIDPFDNYLTLEADLVTSSQSTALKYK